MNYSIENDHIRIAVSSKGAELQSFFDKINGIEYMWSGDPQFWAKTSPVLFPIVGTLKDNTYFFDHKNYQLNRHGFARDKEFVLTKQTEKELLFSIKSDEETLKIYPFEFEFSIKYEISGLQVSVTYIVKNSSSQTMFFSVGGHPAFKVPMFEGDEYEDYKLVFGEVENAGRWPITPEGLIASTPIPFLNNSGTIHLTKELFHKDAIVLKNLTSKSVRLISAKNSRGINFDFESFPYLGIWAAKNADFVCIEPWCGIADNEDTNQDFATKEGINQLHDNACWERKWTVTIIDGGQ